MVNIFLSKVLKVESHIFMSRIRNDDMCCDSQ